MFSPWFDKLTRSRYHAKYQWEMLMGDAGWIPMGIIVCPPEEFSQLLYGGPDFGDEISRLKRIRMPKTSVALYAANLGVVVYVWDAGKLYVGVETKKRRAEWTNLK
jgi:hypothetical protein